MSVTTKPRVPSDSHLYSCKYIALLYIIIITLLKTVKTTLVKEKKEKLI
jgi:hypothetical protein